MHVQTVALWDKKLKHQIDLGINNIQFGFIAQDFVKAGLLPLIQETYDPTNKYLEKS